MYENRNKNRKKSVLIEYENFGWEYTKDTVAMFRGHHVLKAVIVRNKDMNNYNQIIDLEKRYFDLKGKIKTYEEADVLTCIILFLLFIIPGIIYLNFKKNQKEKINENNRLIQEKMNAIVNQAKTIMQR